MKKRYDSKFKSKVAVEAIKGERSIAKIASEFGVHPNLVAQWKRKPLIIYLRHFSANLNVVRRVQSKKIILKMSF